MATRDHGTCARYQQGCRCPECRRANTEYARFRRGGGRLRPTTAEGRFWQKVLADPSGCWLWVGSRTTAGYGSFFFSKQRYAHRFAYELCIGKIPDGLELDHLCRIRCCVNPSHLEPVTTQENGRRGMAITARNARKTHCIHGHPFTPENTYRDRNRNSRSCRTCHRERERKRTRGVMA